MLTEIERLSIKAEFNRIETELSALLSNNRKENVSINTQRQITNLTSQKPVIYRARRKTLKGPVTTSSVKSAVRLDVRLVEEPAFPYIRERIDTPERVFNFARILYDMDVEQVVILHLNGENKLNCVQTFSGTINKAYIHIREIIKNSILSASSAVILVHNHPSGQLIFSKEDQNITNELKFAAKLFDIRVLDHVLIAGGCHKSLKEDGLM